MAEPELDSPAAVSDSDDSEKGLKKYLRGCGCLFGLCTLGLGILIIGKFDSGAWASALGAVVIGYLVFNLSGVNGFWEK